MARLLRRQPSESRIRPPAVVGPAVVFGPVRVYLTDQQRPVQRATRRAPHSKLRPPTVIGPPVVFRPVQMKLTAMPGALTVRRRYLIFGTDYEIRPPAVIAAPAVFRPVQMRLADQRPILTPTRRLTGGGHSRILPPSITNPPTVFGPVTSTLDAVRSRDVQQRRRGNFTEPGHYKIRPPAIVGAATTFRPVQVHTVRTRPRPTHSFSKRVSTGQLQLAPAAISSKATVSCTLTIKEFITAAVSSKATVSCTLTVTGLAGTASYDFPPLFLLGGRM